jgi:homoserine dehydrogenase
VDFELANRFGFVIKPVAMARHHGGTIEARVHPAMVPRAWLLSHVPGAKNALYVRSHGLGPSLYYGAGAGMMPTATAVVSDVIEVCRNIQAGVTGRLPPRSFRRMTELPLLPAADMQSRFYMRFTVLDQAGVLGKLTTILGSHAISIAQALQEGPRAPDRPVTIVMLTHEAREGDLRDALARIDELEATTSPTAVIRILGGDS